jgi:hypothetical protein
VDELPLSRAPWQPERETFKLLEEMLAPLPEAQALRRQLEHCLEAKQHSQWAKRLKLERKKPTPSLPET